MILAFEPRFVPLVQNGTKVHTLRSDVKGRWHKGRKIHLWEKSPHRGGKPFELNGKHELICTGVEECHIAVECKGARLHTIVRIGGSGMIGAYQLTNAEKAMFWRRDGFSSEEEALAYFYPDSSQFNDGDAHLFEARLIHWT